MNVLTENHEIDNGEIWKIDNLKISYFNQNFFIDEGQSIEKRSTQYFLIKMRIFKLIFLQLS